MAKYISDKVDLDLILVKPVEDLRVERISLEELKHGIKEGFESHIICEEKAKEISELLGTEVKVNENPYKLNKEDTLYVISGENYYRLKYIY
jgi:LysM repeat protein